MMMHFSSLLREDLHSRTSTSDVSQDIPPLLIEGKKNVIISSFKRDRSYAMHKTVMHQWHSLPVCVQRLVSAALLNISLF